MARMRRVLPLLLVLLSAACASKDGFVDSTVTECGPGAALGIEAGFDSTSSPSDRIDTQRTMLVQVSNNSHQEVTVKSVRVDPMQLNRDVAYELTGGARDFSQVIPEGGDHTFEIPMSSRRNTQQDPRFTGGTRVYELDVVVTVALEQADSYRCRFRLPVPY